MITIAGPRLKVVLSVLYMLLHVGLLPEAWRRVLWSANPERWKVRWMWIAALVPLGSLWYFALGDRWRKPADLRVDDQALVSSDRAFTRTLNRDCNYRALVRSGSRKLLVAAVLFEAFFLSFLAAAAALCWE